MPGVVGRYIRLLREVLEPQGDQQQALLRGCGSRKFFGIFLDFYLEDMKVSAISPRDHCMII